MLNTPHNPTGKVFTREEMDLIARLVLEHDVPWVFTDEIYEHIVYAGHHHPARDVARDARAHGDDLRALQDVQLHGLAAGLRDRAARRRPTPSGRCTTS